jgi:cobyrinic acid a,c-diamide synthase
MLSAAGVQLVPFSPLHDSKLPPGLSAVLLGGGAVAECGQQLAGNMPMLEALRAFAAAGGLVMGEGAALMYLSRSLQRPGQLQHSMGEWAGLAAIGVDGAVASSKALLQRVYSSLHCSNFKLWCRTRRCQPAAD